MLPPHLLVLLYIASTLPLSDALPALQSLPEPYVAQIGERRLKSQRLSSRSTKTEYVTYSVAGMNQMMTWYNAATGLWQEAWWPSANVVTMLANFQQYFPEMARGITDQVFTTTFAVAEKTFPGYLNGFYDDELWWTLAWIQVYDVTNDQKYLDKAAAIFEDSKNAWGASPCGGLWYAPLPRGSSDLTPLQVGQSTHSCWRGRERAIFIRSSQARQPPARQPIKRLLLRRSNQSLRMVRQLRPHQLR
jgi:hypothetical protein